MVNLNLATLKNRFPCNIEFTVVPGTHTIVHDVGYATPTTYTVTFTTTPINCLDYTFVYT